ncbi:Transcription elongation factor S-II [Dirofilaria immitis]
MGTINTFNLYPDAVDEAATKAKEVACTATGIIKRKISDAAISLKDKASNIMEQMDSSNLPSQALLKESQEGVELQKK